VRVTPYVHLQGRSATESTPIRAARGGSPPDGA